MPFSFASEVAESHSMDCSQADELLRTIVQENRKPNYAEAVFFQQKMGWDSVRVNDQYRRMNSVLRLQAVCGSLADRQAAQDECKTSADVLAKEEPKLEAKVAELQSKLEGLRRDARLSARRCEEQTQAVRQLRELIPQHILLHVQAAVATIADTLRRDVLDAESRIQEIQCCITPSKYANENSYLEALRRSFREAITDHVEGHSLSFRLSTAWPGIRNAIEAELSALQSRLPDMKAEYTAAIEAAEAPLDYYSSGQTES